MFVTLQHMSETISIDYALCMEASVGSQGGLRDEELESQAKGFSAAVNRAQADADSERIGFWNLPSDQRLAANVKTVAGALPDGVTDVLILGIGGSSLGARALYHALCCPVELAGLGRLDTPRLHMPDNSDPYILDKLLTNLVPKDTCVLVISKSGGTVETAAQLLIVQAWMNRALDAAQSRDRFVAITDPQTGSLRELASSQQWHLLTVPQNVGGRFSVLTAVGLLPALLCGVDIDSMLSGAQDMSKRCLNPSLRENPAGIIATVHVLQHRLRGRNLHVMMPYTDQLRPFSAWYVQLWAESLGKRQNLAGEIVEQGPTPLSAVGATDQHAQMQLFMEGPRDKLITFVRVAEPSCDIEIPKADGANTYLGGLSLTALLDAELQGTVQALAANGRPSLSITMPRIDATQLGALFYLYEAATALAGDLYGVDPFDQPGVEHGKRLAFGLLGRDGYEEIGTQVRQAIKERPTGYRV